MRVCVLVGCGFISGCGLILQELETSCQHQLREKEAQHKKQVWLPSHVSHNTSTHTFCMYVCMSIHYTAWLFTQVDVLKTEMKQCGLQAREKQLRLEDSLR